MAPLHCGKDGSKKKIFSRERPRGPRTSAPPDLSTVVEDSKENQQSSIQGGAIRDVLGRDCRVGKTTNVSFRRLLSLADGLDGFLMAVGAMNGFFHGITITCTLLSMGSAFTRFEDSENNLRLTANSLSQVALIFLYISIALFITSFLEQSCWMYTGERQATCLRKKALEAIMKQELGFFETEDNTGTLISITLDDIGYVQDAIEKVGHCICFTTSFAGSLMAAMYHCWQLGFVALVTLPLIAVIGGLYNNSLIDLDQQSIRACVEANSIAEEIISQIRTVYSNVGEAEAIQSYSSALNSTSNITKRQGLAKGFGLGALNCVMFLSWACLIWLGAVLVVAEKTEATWVVISLFCIIFGGLTLWMAIPDFQAFTRGKIACTNVWEVVERIPKLIDGEDATVMKSVEGRIQLRNIHFAYPGPSTYVPVLIGMNLIIPEGKSMALVGACGSGRSTVLSLIQRLYDPAQGDILLDGHDIRVLELQWLRSQMGVVSQEPAIFATSIKENILLGGPNATEEEIETAAKMAHAHSFISALPLKYDTHMGEGGAKLTEGQRQRIAIARAVLRNPAILLLDEATSALDEKSEQEVMDTLRTFMTGRTSVIVAHRPSTTRDVDCVAVIKDGRVVELGTHDELLAMGHTSSFFNSIYNEHQQSLQRKVFFPSKQGRAKAISKTKRSKVPSSGTPPWCDDLSVQYYVRVNSPMAVSLTSSAFLKHSTANSGRKDKISGTKIWATLRKLAKMSLPCWRSALFGTLGAIAAGCLTPISAYALISAAVDLVSEKNKVQSQINDWALILTVLGCSSVFICTINDSCYFRAGESVSKSLRQMLFSDILQKDMGWFDREENSAAKIVVRLAEGAHQVKVFCSEYGTIFVRSTSAMVLAVSLSSQSSWPMTLLAILLTPFFVLSGLMLVKSITGLSSDLRKSHEASDKLARDAIVNIKAIASCTAEERTMTKFSQMLEEPLKKGPVESLKQGILYGGYQGLAQVAITLFLLFCGFLLRKGGQVTLLQIFRAFFVVASTSSELSQMLTICPDMSRSLRVISSLFNITEYQTEIDPNSNISKRLPNLKGSIEMRGVYFSYPARPEIRILNNLNLKVVAGKPLVLVGESGSGKSCVVALLQRFYDPQAGQVFIDRKDLRHLHLRWMRENMSLVPQTPAIFNMSIRENILFGNDNVSEQEMIQAAKTANAHSFISALPEGYSALVGNGGAQLSAGQKQRIALARAIVRNSCILLVDEPYSNLDPESARIIQDILDRLLNTSSNRTILIVAHRMTRTIQETCEIAVLHHGCIQERGDHATLLQKQEQYFRLITARKLDVQ